MTTDHWSMTNPPRSLKLLCMEYSTIGLILFYYLIRKIGNKRKHHFGNRNRAKFIRQHAPNVDWILGSTRRILTQTIIVMYLSSLWMVSRSINNVVRKSSSEHPRHQVRLTGHQMRNRSAPFSYQTNLLLDTNATVSRSRLERQRRETPSWRPPKWATVEFSIT